MHFWKLGLQKWNLNNGIFSFCVWGDQDWAQPPVSNIKKKNVGGILNPLTPFFPNIYLLNLPWPYLYCLQASPSQTGQRNVMARSMLLDNYYSHVSLIPTLHCFSLLLNYFPSFTTFYLPKYEVGCLVKLRGQPPAYIISEPMDGRSFLLTLSPLSLPFQIDE